MGREILERIPPPPDHRIAYGDDQHQFGELRLPRGPGPHPLLISIHGGFWRAAYGLEHMGHLCAALAKQSIATWNIEYRRLGQEGGGWPGTAEDVLAAAAHTAELSVVYPLDLSRTVIAGFSAGGQLALWLAAQEKVRARGALSLAGVVDLRQAHDLHLGDGVVAEFLGGAPGEVPERYAAASPIELLPFPVPIRVIQGTADTRVPFELAERFAARAAETKVDFNLIRLDGADHFELIDPGQAEFATVQRTITDLLS